MPFSAMAAAKSCRLRSTRRAGAAASAGEQGPGTGAIEKLAGAELGPIDPTHPLYGKVTGVLVVQVEPGSLAAFNGLQDGDIITAVNRQNVASVQALSRVVREAGSPFALDVVRGSGRLFMVIR